MVYIVVILNTNSLIKYYFFFAYSYFAIGYLFSLQIFINLIPGNQFISLVHLVLAAFFILIYLVYSNNKVKLKNYYSVFVYIIILALLLSLSSLSSNVPYYSLSRSFLTLIIFVFMFIVFSVLIEVADREIKWEQYKLFTLLLTLLIILVGQLLLPEWQAGFEGIRLSGGTNPNSAAYFGFFAVFVSHYYALNRAKWLTLNKICWLLGLICIAWSLSRSVIIMLGCLYAFFLFNIYAFEIVSLIKGKLPLRLIRLSILLFALLIIIILAYLFIEYLPSYEFIIQRLLSESGMRTRYSTWISVWPYFTDNPFFGSAGWWNLTRILSDTASPGGVQSPHSLYVRLLTETGIIGTFWIILFPIVLFLKQYSRIISKIGSNNYIYMFLAAGIFSIFIGQFFEDRYLTGLGSIENGMIMWVLVLAFIKLQR